MKKFNMIIVTTILVMASVSIVAQNQLPRWALNGKEINFVNNQTNSTNQYVSTPRFKSLRLLQRKHKRVSAFVYNY